MSKDFIGDFVDKNMSKVKGKLGDSETKTELYATKAELEELKAKLKETGHLEVWEKEVRVLSLQQSIVDLAEDYDFAQEKLDALKEELGEYQSLGNLQEGIKVKKAELEALQGKIERLYAIINE